MPVDLFISYSREDQKLRQELGKHLSGLRNLGIINDWFDGDIIEGTEWEPQLFAHLETAQIILLLISPDFIASKFCYHTEMAQALFRHNANEARVIPIILRPTDWKNLPFARLQALPKDGKPVTLWANHDEALLDVIRGIKRAIRELLESKNFTSTDRGNEHMTSPNHPNSHARKTSKPGSRTITHIEEINGQGTVLNIGETVHSSVSNTYTSPMSAKENQSQQTANSGHTPETLLAAIESFIHTANTLFDCQQISAQDSFSEEIAYIDPQKRLHFINMLWELKQQSLPVPFPLLALIQKFCDRFSIDYPLN